MKRTTASRISSTVAALACLQISLHVNAATLQTVGARSAAAFDTLNAATVVHLETSTEGE
jgi:hypothetical protein